jgi:hypothetical protein
MEYAFRTAPEPAARRVVRPSARDHSPGGRRMMNGIEREAFALRVL